MGLLTYGPTAKCPIDHDANTFFTRLVSGSFTAYKQLTANLPVQYLAYTRSMAELLFPFLVPVTVTTRSCDFGVQVPVGTA
jgi:hypothetical protein